MKPTIDFDGLDGILPLQGDRHAPDDDPDLPTVIVPHEGMRAPVLLGNAQAVIESPVMTSGPVEIPVDKTESMPTIVVEPRPEQRRVWLFAAAAAAIAAIAIFVKTSSLSTFEAPKVTPIAPVQTPENRLKTEAPKPTIQTPPIDEPSASPVAPPTMSLAEWLFPGRFSFDAAEPTGIDEAGLRSLMAELATCENNSISITGHSCSVGTEAAQIAVAKRRAVAVHQFLLARGLASGAIRVESAGRSQPLRSDTTREGREANRRVVVQCLKPDVTQTKKKDL